VLLLFIKMEHENAQSGVMHGTSCPKAPAGRTSPRLDGPNLLTYYKATLLGLSQSTDPLISAIYADAQTRMKEPRHLKQLISAIDSIDWYSAPSATASATSTKACWKRTPPKPKAAPASTSPRAR
jgi:type I restriction enzyme M protein